MEGAVDELSTFLLGYFSYLIIIILIIKYFKIFQFKLLPLHTYKPLSYVMMAEVKHIPSTVHAPPAILLQVRKFMN